MVGTGPVRNAYIGMAHVNIAKDLNNLPDFISAWNYPNQNQVIKKSEYGAVNQLRILLSSVGSRQFFASGLGNTVYEMFVTGLDAYGSVEQDNFASQLIFRDAMYSDSLAQNVTLSAVTAWAGLIQNDLWLFKMLMTTRSGN